MKEYIPLKDYADKLNIQKGEIVFVSSDATKIMWDAISQKIKPDLNEFIDGLIEAVGPTGTVIFPTYNWDFCKGVTYDGKKTPCKTGSLGTLALEREDFQRTKHPIYSFAVHGKYAEEFVNMTNTDSFGTDSPFAFFKEHEVNNYIIDVSLQHCFTFVHYVEEQSGLVHHRYIKDFTAGYVDEDGVESQKTYSMFVRDLDLDVQTTINPIEEDFISDGAEEIIKINSSEIKKINLSKVYDIILKDIKENRSRKICKYKGQED